MGNDLRSERLLHEYRIKDCGPVWVGSGQETSKIGLGREGLGTVTARHSSYHQHGAGLIGGGKPGWHRAGGKVGLTSMANLLPLTLFFYFTC